MPISDITMLNLQVLEENLRKMMDPQVLQKLAELLTAMSSADTGSLLDRFKYFCEHSKEGCDCRYAQLAKKFFEQDEAAGCAEAIRWLYEHWAKDYK